MAKHGGKSGGKPHGGGHGARGGGLIQPRQGGLTTSGVGAASVAAHNAAVAAHGVPPTPAALRAVNTPTKPFLTPEQQKSIDDWVNNTYNPGMATLAQNDTTAGATEAQALTNDRVTAQTNTNTTEQDMAARGLEMSSIRDNALNDIAGTQAMNDNIARTNYTTALSNDAIARQALQRTYNEQGPNGWYTNALAVQNAEGVTPPTLPPNQPYTTTTNSPNPAPGTNPAAAGAGAHASATPTQPPKVVSATNQPTSSRPNKPPKTATAPKGHLVAPPRVGMLTPKIGMPTIGRVANAASVGVPH